MKPHYPAAILGAFATTLLFFGTSCGNPQSSVRAGVRAGRPAAEETPDQSSATQLVNTARAAEAQKLELSEAKTLSTGTGLPNLVAKATTSQIHPSSEARVLNAEELAVVKRELDSSSAVLGNHSFSLNLPDRGDVFLVASRQPWQEFQGQAMHRLVLQLRSPSGAYETLIPAPSRIAVWNFAALKTVAFEDVNGDGLGPDIVAIAEYDMGEGFRGEDLLKPSPSFPLAMVYFKEADGGFAVDMNVSEHLERKGAGTIEEVREVVANSSEVLEGW